MDGTSSSVGVDDAEDAGLGCRFFCDGVSYHPGEVSSTDEAGVTVEQALPQTVEGVAGAVASDKSISTAPSSQLTRSDLICGMNKWSL